MTSPARFSIAVLAADRPVVDHPGLSGRFDLHITPGVVTRDDAGSQQTRTGFGLFSSLQDQLGLKLDSTRAEVDVLVIRRIQRPTEN